METMNDFSCPYCCGSLNITDNCLKCVDCIREFSIKEGIANLNLDDTDFKNIDMLKFFDEPFQYESLPYFASLYGYYGNLNVHPIKKIIPFVTMTFKNIINNMLEIDGKVALDVACGTGMYTRNIARKASKVYGIDISEGMLKTALKYSKLHGLNNIIFARASADNLPFKDNFFDGVSCCCALHLFNDLNRSLGEMNRVLNEGGKLACLTYLRRGFWKNKDIYEIFLKERNIHFFKLNELKKYLENAGFSNFKYNIGGSMIIFEVKKSPY